MIGIEAKNVVAKMSASAQCLSTLALLELLKLRMRAHRRNIKSQAFKANDERIARELDRTDRAILHALQRDASMSNVALAAKVNLSAPACLRRVERLKRLGLITGIVALLNPEAVDAGMLVLIGVVLDRSTPESFAEFEKAVIRVSGCMECHVVAGEFDYFMLVRTRDNDSYNRLHAEQLLHLPGVRQIRSFMVLKQVLSTTQLPI